MSVLAGSGAIVAVVTLAVVLVAALGSCLGLAIWLNRTRRRLARAEAEIASLTEGGDPPRLRARETAERAVRRVVDAAVTVRRQGVGGFVLSSLDDLSRWAQEDRSAIARMAGEDGSVTVMFSDIEGSTSLNDELGDEGWVQLLIAHDAMVRAHVGRRGGHVVKSQGDGFMIVFDRPRRAVKAGLDIQGSFSEARSRLMRRHPISVRIGIHTGTVVTRGDDVFGLNVAIAARVAALADGGQTLLTEEVAEHLAGDKGFALTGLPPTTLKGVPGPRTLYAVRRPGLRT